MPGMRDIADRWLWLSLGLATLVVLLTKPRDTSSESISESTSDPQEPLREENASTPKFGGEISQQNEDEVEAAALYELTKHPNRNIRNSAMTILCKRALRSSVVCASIAKDYTQHPDSSTTRTQAGKAVGLLRRFSARAFDGIIPYNDARITLDENWRNRSVIWVAENDLTEGNDSVNILYPLMNGPDGPISWAALMTPYIPSATTSDSVAPTPTPPTPRVREGLGSERERAVRRRRREAIVLNEGDRPLTQDDIIQRPMGG